METKDRIIEFLKANKKTSVEELRKELNISRQAIHRHLNGLLEAGKIDKAGTPPTVFYILSAQEDLPELQLPKEKETFIEKNYLWVSG